MRLSTKTVMPLVVIIVTALLLTACATHDGSPRPKTEGCGSLTPSLPSTVLAG